MATKRKVAPKRKVATKRKVARKRKVATKRKAKKAQTIVLNSVFDLRAATLLAGEFKKKRGADIELDASNVERLGAQCAQILLSAEKTWAAEGLKMLIADSSSEFKEGLDILGVQLCENQSNGGDACL